MNVPNAIYLPLTDHRNKPLQPFWDKNTPKFNMITPSSYGVVKPSDPYKTYEKHQAALVGHYNAQLRRHSVATDIFTGLSWGKRLLRTMGRIINAIPYGKCTGKFAELEQVRDMRGEVRSMPEEVRKW